MNSSRFIRSLQYLLVFNYIPFILSVLNMFFLKILFCQETMWSYRYIFATILTFFCVEVGLWIFCKLGEPTVHVEKTQINPTGTDETDLQEMKFEIYSKQKGPTYKRGVKKISPRFLKF